MANLELDFVYGYHGSRCRDNLFYTEKGEILYHTAAIGIVLDPKANKQRFFQGHTDDIISLSLHPDGKTVATGQIGKEPYIAVWDSDSMDTVALLKGQHQRGVCSMGWSQDGKYLVSVGLDDNHTMAVWDWKAGRVIASSAASKERVFDIEVCPYSEMVVTCGVKHIKFWKYSGNSLISKKGIFGKVGGIQTILCISFGHSDGLTYTGTLSGDVYIWKDNILVKTVKAHRGPVYSIVEWSGGFLSGGKDGKLQIWDKQFQLLDSVMISAGNSKVTYNIRSLRGSNDGKFLVGTKTSEIFQVDYTGGKGSAKCTLFMEGHAEGELWGLDVKDHLILSASDDKTARMWDADQRACILSVKCKFEARSCSFSPTDDVHFAVGFLNGSFSVYEKTGKTANDIFHKKIRKEEISQIKYSPDGAFIAIGSHDNYVDVYDSTKFSRIGVCKGNTSFITHLDWSKDSKFIRTNSGSYETLYFEVPSCKHAPRKPTKDWASTTCVLGKNVRGIWPPYSDKTDINAMDLSPDSSMLITGDDFGLVKVFDKYPCPTRIPSQAFKGHSAHVTGVKWTPDSKFVMTSGGGDQGLFQWRVEDDDGDRTDRDDEDEMDSDLEREKEIQYTRSTPSAAQEAAAPQSGPPSSAGTGAFSLDAPDQIAMSARPAQKAPASLGYRTQPKVGSEQPESGRSLSAHIDTLKSPKDSLTLDWIHGYRAYDARDNLYFNANDEAVYHVAAVGIVCNTSDPKKMSQKFFIEHHRDDIISLTIDQSRKLVATGEVGKDPYICVWDSTTLEKLAVLHGFHERGICALSFSPDGQQLATVGLDNKHNIAVYNWRKGTLLSSGNGSMDKIFGIKYNPYAQDGSFVTVGVKHIKFSRVAGNGLVMKKGIFGKKGSICTMLCVTFDKEFTYTGAANGLIHQWKANQLAKTIEAHTGPIFTIDNRIDAGQFISGGKDGVLKIWGSGFKPDKSIDISAAVGRKCVLRAADISDKNPNKCLVGDVHGLIIEADLSASSAKLLLNGHGMGELWGMATHPSHSQFATASDDKNLKIWDIPSHSLIKSKTLKKAARSVAYSPDGNFIAVGFINGGFAVYSLGESVELADVFAKRERKEAIHEIKFSPDGKYLAVGSHDNFVDLYSVGEWRRKGRCSGNSSYITHVDFTEDSSLLMTNSGAYEQLYFQVPSGKRITVSKKSERTLKFSSWTSVLGNKVGGIWPKGSDGTDVNTLDRSKGGTNTATGDDFGKLNLYSWPVPEGSKPKLYGGHSAHVTQVRFSHDDGFLISCGGGDTSIFQWRFGADDGYESDEEDEAYDSDIEKEKQVDYVPRATKMNALIDTSQMEELEDAMTSFDKLRLQMQAISAFKNSRSGPAAAQMFDKDDSGAKDVVHAGKNVYKDKHAETQFSGPNSKSLTLEFIHGYRGGPDSRNNLFYLNNGECVYHVAAAGIVFDPKKNSQKFFLGHNDDIVSLAFEPTQQIVATGQVGKDPTVCVWDPKNLKSLSVLRGFHRVAVAALSFSPNGKMLVSVGLDNDHSVAVWKWKEGIKVASGKGHLDTIFDVTWNPFSDLEFVTVGVKHVKFWKLTGSMIESRKGIFGKTGSLQTILCCAFSKDKCYTGTISGVIYEWTGNNLTRAIQSHEGPVLSMNPLPGGGYVSGGKDDIVRYWSDAFDKPTKSVQLPLKKDAIRSVTASKNNGVLVGTSQSQLYAIGSDDKPIQIGQGHGNGELWGLSTHPKSGLFATASDDKYLRVWDIEKKTCVNSFRMKKAARSVDFSADGSLLAVGLIDGGFLVKSYPGGENVTVKRNRKEAVHEIKFSPNGKWLAVGSHDNFVDIYDISNWKMIGCCKGNSSYITHVDWSKDSGFIMTNSGAYEHLLYAAPSGKRQTSRKICRMLHQPQLWHSWTGVLGKEIQGIWPKNSDHTDINSLDVSKTQDYLVTADDFGLVKVFNFPCPNKGAEHKKFHGHSAHVTNVRFNFDDSYVISTGGGDRAVFQWKVQ